MGTPVTASEPGGRLAEEAHSSLLAPVPPLARVENLLDVARTRWLTIEEIYDVLIAEQCGVYPFHVRTETVHQPPCGSIVLYRRSVKGFRRDGYAWKMKEGHKRQGQYAEGHMKLRLAGEAAVNVYYGKPAVGGNMERRMYWLLSDTRPKHYHVVAVHYLTSELADVRVADLQPAPTGRTRVSARQRGASSVGGRASARSSSAAGSDSDGAGAVTKPHATRVSKRTAATRRTAAPVGVPAKSGAERGPGRPPLGPSNLARAGTDAAEAAARLALPPSQDMYLRNGLTFGSVGVSSFYSPPAQPDGSVSELAMYSPAMPTATQLEHTREEDHDAIASLQMLARASTAEYDNSTPRGMLPGMNYLPQPRLSSAMGVLPPKAEDDDAGSMARADQGTLVGWGTAVDSTPMATPSYMLPAHAGWSTPLARVAVPHGSYGLHAFGGLGGSPPVPVTAQMLASSDAALRAGGAHRQSAGSANKSDAALAAASRSPAMMTRAFPAPIAGSSSPALQQLTNVALGYTTAVPGRAGAMAGPFSNVRGSPTSAVVSTALPGPALSTDLTLARAVPSNESILDASVLIHGASCEAQRSAPSGLCCMRVALQVSSLLASAKQGAEIKGERAARCSGRAVDTNPRTAPDWATIAPAGLAVCLSACATLHAASLDAADQALGVAKAGTLQNERELGPARIICPGTPCDGGVQFYLPDLPACFPGHNLTTAAAEFTVMCTLRRVQAASSSAAGLDRGMARPLQVEELALCNSYELHFNSAPGHPADSSLSRTNSIGITATQEDLLTLPAYPVAAAGASGGRAHLPGMSLPSTDSEEYDDDAMSEENFLLMMRRNIARVVRQLKAVPAGSKPRAAAETTAQSAPLRQPPQSDTQGAAVSRRIAGPLLDPFSSSQEGRSTGSPAVQPPAGSTPGLNWGVLIAPNEHGNTLAHYAALGDNPELLEWVIQLGVDINALNTDAVTPLACAALCQNTRTVRQLLAAGAQVVVVGKGSAGTDGTGRRVQCNAATFCIDGSEDSSLSDTLTAVHQIQLHKRRGKRSSAGESAAPQQAADPSVYADVLRCYDRGLAGCGIVSAVNRLHSYASMYTQVLGYLGARLLEELSSYSLKHRLTLAYATMPVSTDRRSQSSSTSSGEEPMALEVPAPAWGSATRDAVALDTVAASQGTLQDDLLPSSQVGMPVGGLDSVQSLPSSSQDTLSGLGKGGADESLSLSQVSAMFMPAVASKPSGPDPGRSTGLVSRRPVFDSGALGVTDEQVFSVIMPTLAAAPPARAGEQSGAPGDSMLSPFGQAAIARLPNVDPARLLQDPRACRAQLGAVMQQLSPLERTQVREHVRLARRDVRLWLARINRDESEAAVSIARRVAKQASARAADADQARAPCCSSASDAESACALDSFQQRLSSLRLALQHAVFASRILRHFSTSAVRKAAAPQPLAGYKRSRTL